MFRHWSHSFDCFCIPCRFVRVLIIVRGWCFTATVLFSGSFSQTCEFSLQRSTTGAAELLELYEDRDSQRLDEMQAIHGPNAFNEFYFRLKGVRDFHRKHPDEVGSVDKLTDGIVLLLNCCYSKTNQFLLSKHKTAVGLNDSGFNNPL